MRRPLGFRLIVVGLAVVVTLGLVREALHAQGPTAPEPTRPRLQKFAPGLGGGLGGQKNESEPTEPAVATAYLSPDLTPRSAATWMKLQDIVPMQFPNETPLEEILKYIKEVTKGKDPKGIPIYVSPTGLLEVEKTLTSPVQIDVEGITLASSLKLLLKQLNLAYYVRPDGLLVITSENDEDLPLEHQSRVLEELNALRLEVAALRREIRSSGGAR